MAASAFGALLIGGAAVAASLAGATAVAAQTGAATPVPVASTSPGGANGTTGTTATTGTNVDGRGGPCGHGGGLGPNHEAATDTSVAATAIRISESDLTTALASGQSMAAVAKAHNVDPQKVIDALVADAQSEIAAAVTAGTLTQVQADTELANVTTGVTDQVNGIMPAGGRGGPGGHDGPAPFGAPSV